MSIYTERIESLLICCTKFQSECRNKFPNTTIKETSKDLLDTCEFDHYDYTLNIVSVPKFVEDARKDTNSNCESNDSRISSAKNIINSTPILFNDIY